MGQGDGMNRGFNEGRLYERRETASFIEEILKLSDPLQVKRQLEIWQGELEMSLRPMMVVRRVYVQIA